MLSNLSIIDFLNKTASGEPLPGGGSTAALNGSLGAALTEMVANLSIGRKGFEAVENDMRSVAKEAGTLRLKLTADIDRDADAYSGVLAAYKLPKSTESEKAKRSHAIQEAFKEAARVPMGVARNALSVMELGRRVLARGNSNAASDGAAGVLAARMAVRAAVYNVRINLQSIKDADFTSALRTEVDQIEAEAEQKEKEILSQLKL